MGPATPSAAPVNRPKPAKSPPPAARSAAIPARPAAPPPRLAAPTPDAAAKPQPAARAVPPPPPSDRPVPRRWLRSLACAFAVLLALIAGEIGARSRPEAALRFQEIVADASDRLPASLPSTKLLPMLGALAFVLVAVVVWQAGRPRRPLFLPLALVLCLASAAFGVFRGGHDVDVERNAACFKGRVGSLESELVRLRQNLASSLSAETRAESVRLELEEWKKAATKQWAEKDQAMAQALAGLELKLREQTSQAQEAQADRDKMAASLQQSSSAHQAVLKEKDEVLSALRKEIEELKRKLAEKP
jgi:hypothetical protein